VDHGTSDGLGGHAVRDGLRALLGALRRGGLADLAGGGGARGWWAAAAAWLAVARRATVAVVDDGVPLLPQPASTTAIVNAAAARPRMGRLGLGSGAVTV
jgi:hypothetical protein